MNSRYATTMLNKQYKEACKYAENFFVGLEEDDIFKWNITIIGQEKTTYEGYILEAIMTFDDNYPNQPPKVVFKTKMFHPNIYNDGTVCLSILHPPGDDEYGYESAVERWRPINTAYSVIQSVINLLYEPNEESPANIEAGIAYRTDIKEYNKTVRKLL